MICAVITVAAALVFLAVSDILGWDSHQELVWFGLLLIFFIGVVCLNAITVDSVRTARPADESAAQMAGATPSGGSFKSNTALSHGVIA